MPTTVSRRRDRFPTALCSVFDPLGHFAPLPPVETTITVTGEHTITENAGGYIVEQHEGGGWMNITLTTGSGTGEPTTMAKDVNGYNSAPRSNHAVAAIVSGAVTEAERKIAQRILAYTRTAVDERDGEPSPKEREILDRWMTETRARQALLEALVRGDLLVRADTNSMEPVFEPSPTPAGHFAKPIATAIQAEAKQAAPRKRKRKLARKRKAAGRAKAEEP